MSMERNGHMFLLHNWIRLALWLTVFELSVLALECVDHQLAMCLHVVICSSAINLNKCLSRIPVRSYTYSWELRNNNEVQIILTEMAPTRLHLFFFFYLLYLVHFGKMKHAFFFLGQVIVGEFRYYCLVQKFVFHGGWIIWNLHYIYFLPPKKEEVKNEMWDTSGARQQSNTEQSVQKTICNNPLVSWSEK